MATAPKKAKTTPERRKEREPFKQACLIKAKCVFRLEAARIRFEKAVKTTAMASELLDEEHQARLQYNYQEKQRQKDALLDAIKKQNEAFTHVKACEAALQLADEECNKARNRFRSSVFLQYESSGDDSD